MAFACGVEPGRIPGRGPQIHSVEPVITSSLHRAIRLTRPDARSSSHVHVHVIQHVFCIGRFVIKVKVLRSGLGLVC
jgi:hypothetical protein